MKKTLILIIEDEAAIRHMIRFALEPAGYELLEADKAQEGARLISKKHPDLILLDWMLPGLNGIDFVKQLKQKNQTRDIPIIMLTAKAEEENKIKGLEFG